MRKRGEEEAKTHNTVEDVFRKRAEKNVNIKENKQVGKKKNKKEQRAVNYREKEKKRTKEHLGREGSAMTICSEWRYSHNMS